MPMRPPFRSIRRAAALAAALLLGHGSAQAVTFLDPCAHNGIELKADMVLGYHDPTGSFTVVPYAVAPPSADLVSVGPIGATVIAPVTTYGIATTSAINWLPSGGGAPKDVVRGEVSSEFEYGTPTGVRPRDSFRLRAGGTASAFASLDNSAIPADAVFIAHASTEFYVDVMSPLSCKGDVFVAPMRPLAPHEVLL